MGIGFLRIKRALALAAGAAALTVPVALAGDEAPLYTAPDVTGGAMIDETPQSWFVQLSKSPTAEGGNAAAVDGEQKAFRAAAKDAGVSIKENFSYDSLWNGLSVRASASDVAVLRRLSGVTAVYPVVEMTLPDTATVDPEMSTALAMTGADKAQSELGFTGAGIKVAVMDTGVDYDHPDLGGAFGPGNRVAKGYDFVGDAFNASETLDTGAPNPLYSPTPVPDNDPDDCNGHGTHVAGIIGASGSVNGVAPGVTFGAYRVFGCEGSTTADIMLAAMERALDDDMDVLNMSIGSAFQTWPQYPTAVGADRLVEEGMIVVASIGNSGANGVYSAGAPGVGNKVIGVASFDNTHVALNTFTISPDNKAIGYANAAGSPPAPTSGSLPMAVPASAIGCAPLAAGSMTGKAVLIRRGTCTFYTKAFNAQNAGAAAVVLYNNSPGRFSPTVAGTPAITIPVVAISDAEGVLIAGRLAAGPVTLTWTNQNGTFVNPTGGLISSFSSFGMNAELTLKPDIGAPGGLIRSTYPLEKGGFATVSGTSMSSPHVAGSVALLLESQGKADDDDEGDEDEDEAEDEREDDGNSSRAEDVRSALQNSAEPKRSFLTAAFLEPAHRQGAGMIQIDDAITATTLVTPGKLSLGESAAGPATRTLTLKNRASAAVTYTLSQAPALATGGATNAPGYFGAFASAAFSAPTVTVPAGGSATVDVTITSPGGPDKSQYGGYIVLTPPVGGQVLRVPYAGFQGDYQSITVLTPTANGFPWLAKKSGLTYTKQPAGATYTMTGGDVPYFLLHFEHQARLLQLDIVNAVTGLPVHPKFSTALKEEFLPRNATSGGFFAFAWDGTRQHSNGNKDKRKVVEDGQYKIVVKVLKALGDPANPADTETWTSPTITIDRP